MSNEGKEDKHNSEDEDDQIPEDLTSEREVPLAHEYQEETTVEYTDIPIPKPGARKHASRILVPPSSVAKKARQRKRTKKTKKKNKTRRKTTKTSKDISTGRESCPI